MGNPLKAWPPVVALKRAVWRIAVWRAFQSNLAGSEIPIFDAYSKPWYPGTSPSRKDLTILAANQTFPFLEHLLDKIGNYNIVIVEPEDFCADEASKRSASELKQLFDTYGSDKATDHNYHYVYGAILRHRESITTLLEIGLGSNNEDVVSNMGRLGKPGASLRAFRDFLPNAQLYGADIDRRVLFQDDRIRTFFVDQTNLASFEALRSKVEKNLDLIIDDGLHSPNANIATLIFALDQLRVRGWLVIEDIKESALPVWKVVAALLPTAYQARLIRTKAAIVFAVERVG